MGEKSSIIEMLPHLVIVKGHDYEKTNSAEKVPQTLHNNEFIDFFHISNIARFLDENVSLSRVTLVFMSDPTFLFVTRFL